MALRGKGRIQEPARGRIMIYVPADVHKDSAFPFEAGDDVWVTIKDGRLVIEPFKERGRVQG